jgi:hypothetical protein
VSLIIGFCVLGDVIAIEYRLKRAQTRSIKNKCYDPSAVTDDAIDEYGSKYSQPGALRSMFNIYRATVENVRLNKESAKMNLSCPVLAVGSEDFIGKEVHKQMEQIVEEVQYEELDFGHQLTEECPKQLADGFLNFLK